MLLIQIGNIILPMSLILAGYTFGNKMVNNCHWNDNLAEKDIFCFQLAIGQIMVTRKQFLKSKN